MKQFQYNNTTDQRNEIICYAYSLDVVHGSVKDLKKFYNVLIQYFPHTENKGGCTPYDHNLDYTQQWHAARSHVASIISDHKAESRHWMMWWIGALTLFVLTITLVDTVLSRGQAATQVSKCTTAK